LSLTSDRFADKGQSGAFSAPTLSAFGYYDGFGRFSDPTPRGPPRTPAVHAARAPVGRGAGPTGPPSRIPAREAIPTVHTQPVGRPESVSSPKNSGDAPVVSPAAAGWIDPDTKPKATVFESGWINPYIDPRAILATGGQVAIDWGNVVGSIVGGYLDPFGAGDAAQSAFNLFQPTGPVAAPTPGGGSIPTKVTVDTVTGKITPCRRRRRRRLLTASDLNDLAALKTIVGGGASMNAAVVKAVRR